VITHRVLRVFVDVVFHEVALHRALVSVQWGQSHIDASAALARARVGVGGLELVLDEGRRVILHLRVVHVELLQGELRGRRGLEVGDAVRQRLGGDAEQLRDQPLELDVGM
jgi:hypothetical protein